MDNNNNDNNDNDNNENEDNNNKDDDNEDNDNKDNYKKDNNNDHDYDEYRGPNCDVRAVLQFCNVFNHLNIHPLEAHLELLKRIF